MDRPQVYSLIDSERDYQDARWGDLDNSNGVGDFLAYMRRYLNKALDAVNPDQPEEALDNIRKVTAIGVATMEKFGAPNRLFQAPRQA